MCKINVLVFISLVLIGCGQNSLSASDLSQNRTLDSSNPIPQCNKLPSDVSMFVSLKLLPFFEVDFLIGRDFIHAQPSVSFSTPFLEVGVQDEFPVGKTKSDFLYLVIVNSEQIDGRQKRIYCFDLDGKNVEIIPARQHYIPMRIIVSSKEMKIYQAESEVMRYETLDGRHILTVDVSDNQIDVLEIKPLASLPERLAKPRPQFKYCRESIENKKKLAMLICASDTLELILGFFPRLIGRFSPTLGWLTLFLGEGVLFLVIIKKAVDQPDFLKSVLLFLFSAWLILVATNIWPYALLYP